MRTKDVEWSHETYHGTIYSGVYTIFIYEGKEDYSSLKKLCDEGLPWLVKKHSLLDTAVKDQAKDHHAQYEEDVAEWKAQTFLYRMFHATPRLPYRSTRETYELGEMSETLENAKNLNNIITRGANHSGIFYYEDKKGLVVASLMEALE